MAPTLKTMCVVAPIVAAPMVAALPGYLGKIPNGASLGASLGHKSASGGGARTAFGEAFKAAGRTWTKELCQADSDNDGQTNGFELGDPECVWVGGATASRTTDISDPSKADSKAKEAAKDGADKTKDGADKTKDGDAAKPKATLKGNTAKPSKSDAASMAGRLSLAVLAGVVGRLLL